MGRGEKEADLQRTPREGLSTALLCGVLLLTMTACSSGTASRSAADAVPQTTSGQQPGADDVEQACLSALDRIGEDGTELVLYRALSPTTPGES